MLNAFVRVIIEKCPRVIAVDQLLDDVHTTDNTSQSFIKLSENIRVELGKDFIIRS